MSKDFLDTDMVTLNRVHYGQRQSSRRYRRTNSTAKLNLHSCQSHWYQSEKSWNH